MTATKALEQIHPSLWRGSQLARGVGRVIDTGYVTLSAEFPGGGWPVGALVELLVQNTGAGEMRLLAPALASLTAPIALIQPPAEPSVQGLAYVGLTPDRLLLIRTKDTSDQLWSAEQILKSGSCAAVLMWQQHARADTLRRLHLAAKSADTLLFMIRPLSAAQDASSAELRVAIRPTEAGASIEIIKRKGPRLERTLSLQLSPSAILNSPYSRTRRSGADVPSRTIENVNLRAAEKAHA